MNPELVQPSPSCVPAGPKHEEERKDTVSPLWRPDPERMEAPDTVPSSDSGSPSQGQLSGHQSSSPTSSSQASSKGHFWSNYNEPSKTISNCGVEDVIPKSGH